MGIKRSHRLVSFHLHRKQAFPLRSGRANEDTAVGIHSIPEIHSTPKIPAPAQEKTLPACVPAGLRENIYGKFTLNLFSTGKCYCIKTAFK